MYKKFTLEKFEKGVHCNIREWEIEQIETAIKRQINQINEALEQGYKVVAESWDDELWGMRNICTMVGIRVEIKKE